MSRIAWIASGIALVSLAGTVFLLNPFGASPPKTRKLAEVPTIQAPKPAVAEPPAARVFTPSPTAPVEVRHELRPRSGALAHAALLIVAAELSTEPEEEPSPDAAAARDRAVDLVQERLAAPRD